MVNCNRFSSSSWRIQLQLPHLILSITTMMSMLMLTTMMMENNYVMGFSSLSSLSLPTYPLNTFHNKRQLSISILPSSSSLTKLGARDDDEEDDREFARVRRSRGRRSYNDDDDDDKRDTYRDSMSVMEVADLLEEKGLFGDDLDDDEYDDDDDDESYDVFSNTVIPNPLLDSIDPDGAADRFGELASDPWFWFDMFLFISFLNFVSFIGPRNPFPEIIPAMYTAGLPPPGL
jgi:hypothetical protein